AAEPFAAGVLDEPGPIDLVAARPLGAGLANQLLEASDAAARTDRGAAADAGAADIFERLGAVHPALVAGIVGIAAERLGDAVTVALGLARADGDLVLGARRAGIVAVDDELVDLHIIHRGRGDRRLVLHGGLGGPARRHQNRGRGQQDGGE